MKYYKIKYMPRPVKECHKMEKEGSTVIPLKVWSKVPGPNYYDAYNWVLAELRKTTAVQKWEEERSTKLAITYILPYLEIHAEDDRRFNRPPMDYLEPLHTELKGVNNLKQGK